MTASPSGRTPPSPVPAGRPKGKGKVKVSGAQRRGQRKQKTIANPQQPMREKAMSTTPLPKQDQTESISTKPKARPTKPMRPNRTAAEPKVQLSKAQRRRLRKEMTIAKLSKPQSVKPTAQPKERDETKLSKAQRTRMRKRFAKEKKNGSNSYDAAPQRQEKVMPAGPTKPPMRQHRIVSHLMRSIQSGYNSPVSSSTKLSKAQRRRLRKRITKERKREA